MKTGRGEILNARPDGLASHCQPDVYCINFRREFDMEGKPKTTESLLGKDDPLQENTVTQKNSDDKTSLG